jgi:hypothetical protein
MTTSRADTHPEGSSHGHESKQIVPIRNGDALPIRCWAIPNSTTGGGEHEVRRNVAYHGDGDVG